MDYMHATLILHETGREINERNLRAVLEAAGAEVVESRLKAVVAAFEGVDIEAIAPAPEFETPEPVLEAGGSTARAPAADGAAEGVEDEKEADTNGTGATVAKEGSASADADANTDVGAEADAGADADATEGAVSDEGRNELDRGDPEDDPEFEFSSAAESEQPDDARDGEAGNGRRMDSPGGDDGVDSTTGLEGDEPGEAEPDGRRSPGASERGHDPSAGDAETGDEGAR